MISNPLHNLPAKEESLIDFIQQKISISDEVKKAILAHSQTKKWPKGHSLLKEGTTAQHLFFIVKGSARTFYYHADKDITSWIYSEGLLLTSWGSFIFRTPTFEYIELLEASTVTSISFHDLQQLYRDHPQLERFGRLMVEDQLAFLDYFFKGFLFMSAKEKYDLLLSTFPDVTQRVNLGHIASFLGISQETLSRIRKKK